MTTYSSSQQAPFPPGVLTYPSMPASGNLYVSSAAPLVGTLYNSNGTVLAQLSVPNAPFSIGPYAYSGGAPYLIVNTSSAVIFSV